MEKQALIDHYHCCATCRHFGFREAGGEKQPYCTRLGYDTQPKYQFNCWQPKDRVVKAIEKKLGDRLG